MQEFLKTNDMKPDLYDDHLQCSPNAFKATIEGHEQGREQDTRRQSKLNPKPVRILWSAKAHLA